MGVDPQERLSYTITDSVALNSENFLDWENDSDELENSPPASPAPGPSKRSRTA